jgi:sulfite reductase alpha subunit-like flavoprotein
MKNEMKSRMSTELLNDATFTFDDENGITYTVTTENANSDLMYTEGRHGNIYRRKTFQNISDLMFFLASEGIDTEDFMPYDINEDEYLD